MQRLFSSSGMNGSDKFRQWQDFCDDRLIPMEYGKVDDSDFNVVVDGASVGDLSFSRIAVQNVTVAVTPRIIRRGENRTDRLWLNVITSGVARTRDRELCNNETAGDFSVRDSKAPLKLEYKDPSEVLVIDIARKSLENMLGSARLFSGLTVHSQLPSSVLARSFLDNLLKMSHSLSPDAAERMSAVATDLIIASIAERMAMEIPKPLRGTVAVQRAKAYVENNLSDFELDPSQVAAAIGISVRYLHILFRERGRNIGAWIWQRRLETAASRLANPATFHIPLGDVAQSCGFASQSHFSSRFRDRYGVSPRAYRHGALNDADRRS